MGRQADLRQRRAEWDEIMDGIQSVVRAAGFAGDWEITEAAEGASGRTYIARQQGRALFIKLDDPSLGRERLAQLGVTPPLLHHGVARDIPYTVYPAIAAEHPAPAWFGDHLGEVIDLVTTYQRDRQLAKVLGADSARALPFHPGHEMERIGTAFRQASDPIFGSERIARAIERLASQAAQVNILPLVPAHTDPNNTNFLVTADAVRLIDWEGLTLSDPLRDIGLILWWYVPEAHWPEAIARLELTEGVEESVARVYWWAAATSLRVALWIDRHGSNVNRIRSFLDDFIEAEQRRPNPRRISGWRPDPKFV